MGTTPEGKIKDAVKKVLAEYGEDVPIPPLGRMPMAQAVLQFMPNLYSHWPVQNGMGTPTLDCIVCYYGCFLAIETKAPGKKPTPRQELTIRQMKAGGAIVLVIDSVEAVDELRRALDMIKWSHANRSLNEA